MTTRYQNGTFYSGHRRDFVINIGLRPRAGVRVNLNNEWRSRRATGRKLLDKRAAARSRQPVRSMDLRRQQRTVRFGHSNSWMAVSIPMDCASRATISISSISIIGSTSWPVAGPLLIAARRQRSFIHTVSERERHPRFASGRTSLDFAKNRPDCLLRDVASYVHESEPNMTDAQARPNLRTSVTGVSFAFTFFVGVHELLSRASLGMRRYDAGACAGPILDVARTVSGTASRSAPSCPRFLRLSLDAP